MSCVFDEDFLTGRFLAIGFRIDFFVLAFDLFDALADAFSLPHQFLDPPDAIEDDRFGDIDGQGFQIAGHVFQHLDFMGELFDLVGDFLNRLNGLEDILNMIGRVIDRPLG